MTRVLKLSGEVLATSPVDVEAAGKLKEHLWDLHDFPVCLQQLVQDGCILDNASKLDASKDVQLVLLTVSRESRVEATQALTRAAAKGNIDTVCFLLKAGLTPADASTKNDVGNAALHCACKEGHVEIARMLVEAGADMNMRDNFRDTALHCACNKGHVEIACMLVEAGAAVSMKNRGGDTALHFACVRGHVEIARMLVEAGADVRVRNNYGDTAFICACKEGHVVIARMLVAAGANWC